MAKLSQPIFIFLFVLSSWCIPSLRCPQHQRAALLQFKSLLLVNNHQNLLQSWNSSSSDCCKWELVTCYCYSGTNSKQVIGLELGGLSDKDVTSSVLTPLFHIETLVWLEISHNSIRGEIPGIELSNLTKLVRLEMQGNNFNGPIPSKLFSLRHLEYLDLSHNWIEGSLDSDLGKLTNLKELHLQYNLLRGEIPEEIGNLTNLEELYLAGNNFSGEIPLTVQKLAQLERLDLGNNSLSGGIPLGLFYLKKLERLTLRSNKLKELENAEKIPRSNLLYSDLSENQLSGTIPPWLAKLDLVFLSLSSNKLDGSLPSTLFQSQNLEYLDLSDNRLSGALPESIGEATELKLLALSGNNFCGPIPRSFLKGWGSLPLLVKKQIFWRSIHSVWTKLSSDHRSTKPKRIFWSLATESQNNAPIGRD